MFKDQETVEKRIIKSRERPKTWQSTGVIQIGDMASSSKLLNDIC